MGLLVALVVWGLALMTTFLVYNHNYWFPPAWSQAAHLYDHQFMITLTITGIAFLLAQALLGWFILRYADRGGARRARYIHGHNLVEIGGIVLTGTVFMSLAVAGQRVWAQVHLTNSPPDALRIEVTGQQFNWQIRYPGPDGKFGRTAPEFYDKVTNAVGLDPKDPDGKDDIVVPELVVPVGRPVELTLRSWDVIHSFFLPTLRLKQDTVPGLAIPLRFKSDQTGEFEIGCAELCGAGHYTMRSFLKVKTPAEYQQWLAEQTPALTPEEPTQQAPESTAAGQTQ